MIRKLTQEEYNNAADLSYQVCMERNDFTQEGIETFKSFVYDTSLMNTLDIYGAFDNHLLIGIIGVHRERQHISLFFVLPHYHRRGIGTLLFDYMMSNCNFTYITVNSSTYAETFYTSLGFKKVGEKEINKGIVSIPMERYNYCQSFKRDKMKKKITLCMVLSTFIICAMLCLTNCSNDDAPTSVFTPEALKQTTWQAQMTVYNIEDEIDYTKQSILQFTNESEGIYTRTNEEDGYMWNTDFTYQVNGKIITFDNIAGPWTVLEYTGTHLVMEAYNPNKMVWTLEKMY